MKALVHRGDIAALPFDLAELKLHARVGGSDEDALLTMMGKTAAREIEHYSQTALLTQEIRATIFDPVQEPCLSLPIGPVQEGASITVTIDGTAFTAFDLVPGMTPLIRWHFEFFDLSPSWLTIEYQAGFGDAHTTIPDDLMLALLDQASLLYDCRAMVDGRSLPTSQHMARVGARYRGVKV